MWGFAGFAQGFGTLGRIMSASAASAPSLASPPDRPEKHIPHHMYARLPFCDWLPSRWRAKATNLPAPTARCCFAGQKLALPLFGADVFATADKMHAIAAAGAFLPGALYSRVYPGPRSAGGSYESGGGWPNAIGTRT